MKELYKGLAAFHNKGASVKKNSTNPFFKSTYSTLEEVIKTIRSHAGSCGLTFIQMVDFCDSGHFVSTTILHESGESITGRTPIVVKDKTDPQKFGGAITYAKRYGLQSAFGLPSEDDDGNMANAPYKKTIIDKGAH